MSGLKFHPKGYTPKYREGSVQMASTELTINNRQRQPARIDGYDVHAVAGAGS